MPLPSHLTAAKDLVTPQSEIRAGFIKMALEKSARANPHVAAAKALRARAIQHGSPLGLIGDSEIQDSLLAAAGLSGKALQHLLDEDKVTAVAEFVGTYLEPAGADYADELTFRFLLTRGDTLGGEMRNLAGRLGDIRFLSGILGALSIRSWPAYWRHKDTKAWSPVTDAEEASQNGCGLEWTRTDGHPRTLLFNVRVPLVNKNVDSVLLRCTRNQAYAKPNPYVRNAQFYVALGELKGGIDPAGADEHWKTAEKALTRINQAFAGAMLNPARYFIGAAVAAGMADEIFAHLVSGQLSNAANLTSDDQLAAFCEWLVEL